MKTFTKLSNMELRPDGQAFKADFETTDGTTTIEIPVDKIADITYALGQAGIAAGDVLQTPKHPPLGEPLATIAVPATGMCLKMGRPGLVEFVFRAGAADFAFSLPYQVLQGCLSEFPSAVQAAAATAKAKG